MCMVSMMADGYKPWEKWYPQPIEPIEPLDITNWIYGVSKTEFDELKKEVQELRELLKAAIKFDKATNQPDCQNEDKLALLKAMADALGVDLKEVIDN